MEKFQNKVFNLIIYIPVIITFSFLFMLSFFYVYCFLVPCLKGDFESTLGITDFWANDSEKEADQSTAVIFLVIFVILFLNLLSAIILTINTPPGGIP